MITRQQLASLKINHVEIDRHFIKEKVDDGLIFMLFVSTAQQVGLQKDRLSLTLSFL